MEGLDVTRTAGYAFGIGFARRLVARIALASGDLPEALHGFGEALETFAGIGARFEAARTQLELGALAEVRGDFSAAATHAREALRAFTALGAPVYVERARTLAVRLDRGADE